MSSLPRRPWAFTVGFWRKRYIEGKANALYDETRPVLPRRAEGEVFRDTLESDPKGAMHRSTRSMANKMDLSQTMVSRIWRAFALQPHRAETFKLSTDPFFIEKVRCVVGRYMSPPVNAAVLSIDERSQIQALSRRQPVFPLRMGEYEGYKQEY